MDFLLQDEGFYIIVEWSLDAYFRHSAESRNPGGFEREPQKEPGCRPSPA
jgi:hypothetical protein